MHTKPVKPQRAMSSRREFIVLIALMISIVAMTTDVMLPALEQIATDLGQSDPTRGHLVITVLFAGFAVGQLLVGPLADSFGRKPIVHASYAVFCMGSLMSLFAQDFNMLLAGRMLQGLGMSGPRIVSIAIVRDGYAGRGMAQIMSFVMAVFIIVPAVAPAIGQVLIALSGWRATFALLLGMALVSWVWFTIRQPETLPRIARRRLSLHNVMGGIKYICTNRQSLVYIIAVGLIFGPFLAYLSLAQEIFQNIYAKGTQFALWFGVAALAIGAASLVNSALVERWGMRFLSHIALIWVIVVSAILLVYSQINGMAPFGMFMAWLICAFFGMGMLFGNLNALAMEPLGDMAGLGAAVVGAFSTSLSLVIGYVMAQMFAGDPALLTGGFAVACIATLCLSVFGGRNEPA